MVKFLLLTMLMGLNFLGSPKALASDLLALSNPYGKVLREYTRGGSVYSLQDLDTRFKWMATYHSPEFIEAFEAYWSKFYPQGQEGYARELKEKIIPKPGQIEFMVALYAKPQSLKDLGDKFSLWELTLQIGQQNLHPILVEEIPLTSFQARFYPYVDKWHRTYRVLFSSLETHPTDHTMILKLNSVAGHSHLEFRR